MWYTVIKRVSHQFSTSKERAVSMHNYIPIKEKINRKLALRALLCLAVGIVIFAVGYLTTLLYPNKTGYAVSVCIFCSAVFAFCVYKIKFFQLLFEKDFDGEIISKEFWNGYYFPYVASVRGRRSTVYMDIKVKKSNGKTKVITYNCMFISASCYNVGNKVKYLKGTKYLLVTDDNAPIICPLCASTLNSPECSRCKISFADYKRRFFR